MSAVAERDVPSRQQHALVPLRSGTEDAPRLRHVSVQVCGRCLHLDLSEVITIRSVQDVLRSQLAMHEQVFELFDAEGATLSTDGDLWRVVMLGQTPIVATLSATSVHFIENRREELAHMQWKVLRDEFSGLSERLSVMGRQADELAETITWHRREQEASNDRVRSDVTAFVERAKSDLKQAVKPLGERLEAMQQIVQTERRAREMTQSSLEEQLGAVCNSIEEDRVAHQRDQTQIASLVKNYGFAVSDEVAARMHFEGRQNRAMDRMHDRIEAALRSNALHLEDLGSEIQRLGRNVAREIDTHSDQVARHSVTTDACMEDLVGLEMQFEERLTEVEILSGARPLEDRDAKGKPVLRLRLGEAPVPQLRLQPPQSPARIHWGPAQQPRLLTTPSPGAAAPPR
eukprot:NODE_4582_length_1873_cov_7.302978.p1 GENE.NODE_4582_length_1873_cov_7.302978~~NODE_4582_length_1873_cov_7.302978.p1  ORF type:complete len:402 (+),score=144.91 NODE_4582_length_1873_cov_7.302978:166-1371(+)